MHLSICCCWLPFFVHINLICSNKALKLKLYACNVVAIKHNENYYKRMHTSIYQSIVMLRTHTHAHAHTFTHLPRMYARKHAYIHQICSRIRTCFICAQTVCIYYSVRSLHCVTLKLYTSSFSSFFN